VPMVSLTSLTLKRASPSTITLLTIHFHLFSFHPPFLCNLFSLLHNIFFHLHHLHTLLRSLLIRSRNSLHHFLLLPHPRNVLVLLRNFLFHLRNPYIITRPGIKHKTHIKHLIVYQFLLCTYLHSLRLRLFSIEI
jgi:hypothetical protein